jgi:hypothetical protein
LLIRVGGGEIGIEASSVDAACFDRREGCLCVYLWAPGGKERGDGRTARHGDRWPACSTTNTCVITMNRSRTSGQHITRACSMRAAA